MKTALLIIAVACLAHSLYASLAYWQGWLPADVFLRQFQYDSLGWFVCATWWVYRK